VDRWLQPDHVPAGPAGRARAILLDDHTLSNAEVSLRARAPRDQVTHVRYRLVSAGMIPPSRVVPQPPPRFKPLPRQPRELMQGACVGHPRADAWLAGASDYDREMAKNTCLFACPVTEACVEWALSLPTHDQAIYGGTTADDRDRIRASRAGPPVPARLDPALRRAARARRRAAARQAQDGAA
jgi:hypothetical protein